jgi:8-oxo-dGTP pyrophosphatase MutT (NUDIX family)
MSQSIRWETLREQITRDTGNDLVARDRLMPRDEQGLPTRPGDAPATVVPRAGAVLLLLYPDGDEIYVPLTVRTSSLRNHSGEISLPGGSADPTDNTLADTALREAWEELGISPGTVEIVTSLAQVWIPVSNFRITPYVGLTPAQPAFTPAPTEVAAVIEVPLNILCQPATLQSEMRELRGRMVHIPYFAIDEHKVWGATALILAQLVGRLTG